MTEAQTYYKDGVARIIELLKDALGDGYTYFNGQPEEIPESLLPCVMVSETVGKVESHATGTDLLTETIMIIIALNKKDDILGPDPNIDLTEFKLRKLVKGQHPDTGEYLPETVMYALRKHITMSDSILKTDITTDFDENVRGEETVTQEAYVTVRMERLAIVPSRD
jgi:hypothetical protein